MGGSLGSKAAVWLLLPRTPEAMLPSLRCTLATLGESLDTSVQLFFSWNLSILMSFPHFHLTYLCSGRKKKKNTKI